MLTLYDPVARSSKLRRTESHLRRDDAVERVLPTDSLMGATSRHRTRYGVTRFALPPPSVTGFRQIIADTCDRRRHRAYTSLLM